MSNLIVSTEIFVPLYNFLKSASLEKITISRIFTQQWKLFKIQPKEEDCECLINILRSVENEIVNAERKEHIQSLQDINKIYYSRDELISLVDAGELRGNFKEYINWRNMACNNITILKNTIKNGGTPAHNHIYTKICEVRVEELSQDDPLCNGVIDLSSDKYQLSENNHIDLMGDKAGIRELSKSSEIKSVFADFIFEREEIYRLRKFVLSPSEMVSHGQWVEEEHEKERVARGITNVLLQEIKLNAFRKVSNGSENCLVEIIARLMDTAMYRLPVEYDIEITRAERQSMASKNRKVQQQKGSRGDKPDLMIRVFFRNKWEEIIYVESGKWNCDDEKIRSDHNKLVQLCMDGSNELFKICEKEPLNRNYIGFGVNIAGECIEIYGLVREKGVKYYFPVSRAKIPFRKESAEEVEGFIHALLTLRAIANTLRKRSRKNSERSPTHKGEEKKRELLDI
ncbi:unnamed protein product [Rhizophagus irregularis]|uniref:Uncharacterized protein n=1 Tax=Rhizophagus irregularis TaxID=588596 RepID=A0A2N1MKF2_9GLOM|nr:hypothetical protein RhiirC2_870324 [Rhizophagus irregularis]CAB4396389.1 unnamed protein product [Rhizophagus irregularis]